MIFRKRECQQPKIRTRNFSWLLQTEYGQVEWVTGLFFLLFLGIMLCFCLQMSVYRAASLYLEDALAASNLASAVIDIEEYGRTHLILIPDPVEAYERFSIAVHDNLQLDAGWESNNKSLIAGPVTVERYIVYNVKQDMVFVQEVNANGGVHQWQGSLGSVKAPNGISIENTSIYSELSFLVEGMFGVTVQAHKGQLADITNGT